MSAFVFAMFIEEHPVGAIELLSGEFKSKRTLDGDQISFDRCVESIARELVRRNCPEFAAQVRALQFAPNDLKSWDGVDGYYQQSSDMKHFCWSFAKLEGLTPEMSKRFDKAGDTAAYVGD